MWLRGRGGRAARAPGGRRVHCFCVRVTDARAAAVRPHRPPAAGAAQRRGRLRDRGQPRFAGRAWRVRRRLPRADAPGAATPPRASRRGSLSRGMAMSSSPAAASAGSTRRAGSSGCCRATARTSRSSPTPTSCSTRRCCRARRRARSSRATWSCRCARSSTGPTSGSAASPAPTRRATSSRMRTLDGRDESLRYDQLVVALGSVSRVLPVPGWPSTDRLQDARRGDRAAQPRARQPRDRRVDRRPGGAARVADVRLRRRRLRRARGHRRAAGLRGRRDRALPALPRSTARAGSSSRRASGSCRRSRPSLAEFATRELRGRGIEIRTGTTPRRRRPRTRRRCRPASGSPPARVCWTAGVKPPPVVARARPAAGRAGGRIDVDDDHAGAGPRERLGDRRRRRGARPAPSAASAPTPPTAQHALRQGRLVADNVAAALGHGQAAAVPLQDARRVRGHGPPQGGRQDARACGCAASRPGSPRAPTTWR